MSEAAEEFEQEQGDHGDDIGAEATEAEEQPEEGGEEEGEGKSGPKTLPPETQESINARINKEVYRRKEIEQQLAEERRQREQREAELAKLQQPQRPDVPPLPDAYDDDYEAKVQAHYAAKAQADFYDRQQEQARQQEQYQAWQAQQQENAEREALANEYYRRGDNLGYDRETLDTATATVVSFGLSPDLGRHIVADEGGPAVAMYLAANPTELEKVSQMSPIDGAVYIATQIKGKALESRPRADVPEEPPEELSGTGMARGNGGPDGATYE